MTATGEQSQGSHESSQQTSGGAKEARRKANERVGQWVNRKYCLDALLGVGGMATVYAARHRNGSRVALKILHAEFAREEGVRTRFLREGYVANKVDHPGVVRILDDEETEQGEPFLVMELLEGLTLQQLWKKRGRKVPVVEAMQICAAVLDCLVPFHDQKIIHRDIKPANIFITHENEIKLLDFGVAQMREAGEALTRAGTALGTPSFMSPEQAMGKSDQLDGRSDVFAIGATLYAILSGKRLHHGKSDNEAFILAATQPAPSIARSTPDLPVEVIGLVDRALQWDRRKRFRTAAEMRDACTEVIGQVGGAAVVTPVQPTPTHSAPAHPSHPSHPSHSGHPAAPPSASGQPHASAPAQASMPARRHSAREMAEARSPSGPYPFSPPVGPSAAQVQVSRPPDARAQSIPSRQPDPQRQSAAGYAAGTAGAVSAEAQRQRIASFPDSPAVSARQPRAAQSLHAQRSAAPVSQTPHSGISARPAQPPPPGHASAPSIPAHALPADLAKAAEQPRDDHPMLVMFERFEKALPSLRHYGLNHPEGAARARNVHGAMIDALRELPRGLRFQVHPFCFSDGPTTLWEPGPPNDQVPYGMASCGVEEVLITPGVNEEEVRRFLQAIVIDPQLGLTEGDVGAALWEAGLNHIVCQVREDMTDADAREQIRFFTESEEIEEEVKRDLAQVVTMMAQTGAPSLLREDQAEAAAMAMTTDTESFKAAKLATDALRLDPATSATLASQIDVETSEWQERFFDVAAEAMEDAVAREDSEILYGEVRLFVERMVSANKWQEMLETYEVLHKRVAAKQNVDLADAWAPKLDVDDLTRQVFGWTVLHTAFRVLKQEPLEHERKAHELIRQAVSAALPVLGGTMVREFVDLSSEVGPGPLQDLALGYVDRHIDGNQQLIVERLDDLDPVLAQRLLAVVAKSLGARATAMLKPLLMSPNPALRCEATALLAQSPEMLGQALVRLLASTDPRLRSAALTTMLRYNSRHAGPGLVGEIENEKFRTRPVQEQKQMFDTLYALNPPRAEKLLTGLVKQHGMLADEELDRMRSLAADILGEHGDSPTALDTLEDATKMRPWNTQGVRSSASNAIALIKERMSQKRGAHA